MKQLHQHNADLKGGGAPHRTKAQPPYERHPSLVPIPLPPVSTQTSASSWLSSSRRGNCIIIIIVVMGIVIMIIINIIMHITIVIVVAISSSISVRISIILLSSRIMSAAVNMAITIVPSSTTRTFSGRYGESLLCRMPPPGTCFH